MANRHLARSIVLQSLFEWDFAHRDGGDDFSMDDSVSRNAIEFAPGIEEFGFMKELAATILKKRVAIDKIIEKAAPDWPIDKIAIVDRNVLRIGLYELLFADRNEVPPKVAINEAIELAKTFGGDSSGRFVNGVLGAVYRELGEPGKEQISKRDPKKFDLPFEEMPIERLGGAVVYARDEQNTIHLAFVHDVFGHWTLTKGHLLEEEKEQEGIVRKVKEEINLDIEIKEELGRNEYVATHPEKGKTRKQVAYFLAESKFTEPKLEVTGGLDQVKWFLLKDIIDLNFYDDILPIVTKAVNILLKK